MSLHLQCLPLLLNPVLMALLQGTEVEQGILLQMCGLLCLMPCCIMQPPRYVYASSRTSLLEFSGFIALLTLQSYQVLESSSKSNLIKKTSKNLQAAD